MSFGNDMKQARIEKSLTQAQLAEKTGISLRTIQRIENEEVRPSLHSINALGKVLETDLRSQPVALTQNVYQINLNMADMQQLFEDIKKLIKTNWKVILTLVLVVYFLGNYTEIKSGIIDGWNGR